MATSSWVPIQLDTTLEEMHDLQLKLSGGSLPSDEDIEEIVEIVEDSSSLDKAR